MSERTLPSRAVARALRGLLVAGLLAAGGCYQPTQYQCRGDSTCVSGGVQGRCEPVGYCAFPDQTCTTSGYRYDPSAGPLANTCVTTVPDVRLEHHL